MLCKAVKVEHDNVKKKINVRQKIHIFFTRLIHYMNVCVHIAHINTLMKIGGES